MIIRNGKSLLIHPAEVSKQFFYTMEMFVFLSIPTMQSVQIKETQNSMENLLSAVNYQDNK